MGEKNKQKISYSSWKLIGISLSILSLGLAIAYAGLIWYPFIVGSVIAWRRKKPFLSGTMLGFAASLQVFPAIFAVPVTFYAIISLIHHKKDQLKSAFSFLLAFAAIIVFFIIIGSLYAGKFGIWQEWYSKINIHKNYLSSEIFNIGFPNLDATVLSGDHANSYSYIEDYAHTQIRISAFQHNLFIFYILILLGLLLIFATLWRSKQNNPMIFGYFFLYLLLSLSPYYYLILALIPFMFWDSGLFIRKFAIYGTFTLFLFHLIFQGSGYVSFIYNFHLISEISIFLFLATLLFLKGKSKII